jgi:hypothetical protein
MRFAMRMARPALSKAFFSWKYASRQKVDTATITSGMFAEPTLPWNVRHPRSPFTNAWESIQGFLLVYVAFTVVWRLSFNISATGYVLAFENLIDIYFAVDVFLNLHTAWYDDSGDLQGVKSGGEDSGNADIKALYLNYAKGWMAVDVLSVLPVGYIATLIQDETGADDSGAQLRLLKALRLLRLAKLLKLFRAMRLMKKYEEVIGPALNGTILVIATMLILHTMTCVWYYVGTLREVKSDGESTDVAKHLTGWVEHIFQGSERYCGCYNGTHYDPTEHLCVPTCAADDKLCLQRKLREPCSTPDQGTAPTESDYYWKALWLSVQDSSVASDYTHTTSEMYIGSSYIAVMGFLWGSVAGAWTTVFAANQMASQAYRMKMSTVKEFCRIKGLDWGVRAKLQAHYEHLYPEKIIVDEGEIVDSLPPKMREELVRQLYGQVIVSIPLFFGLDSAILTEVCMALVAVPALKGETIVSEGDLGLDMYTIATGQCRVTSHMHIDGDEERARMWVEEVFAQTGKSVTLYTPNRRFLVTKLLKRMRVITRRKKRAYESLLKEEIDLQAALDSVTDVSEKERIAAKHAEVQQKLDQTTPKMLVQDIEDDDDVIELLATENAKIGPVLKLCVKYERVEPISFGIKYNKLTPTSVVTLIPGSNKPLGGESPVQLLCDSLQDGIILCDLFNLIAGAVSPGKKVRVWRPSALDNAVSLATDTATIADDVVAGSMGIASTATNAGVQISDRAVAKTVKTASTTVSFVPDKVGGKVLDKSVQKVDALQQQTVGRAAHSTASAVNAVSAGAQESKAPSAGGLVADTWAALAGGPGHNVNAFCEAIVDPELPFRVAAASSIDPDDLLKYNKGSAAEQDKKQSRILACILELAFQVSNLEGYYGPKLDEVHLGMLGPGEFFGELSLLPVKLGWHHRRSVTSVQNALLYSISKQRIEQLGQTFPPLQHALAEHAEDWEKTIAASATSTGISSRNRTTGTTAARNESTKQAPMVEHNPVMHVQEQLHQQDVKLSNLDLKFSEQDAAMAKLNDKVDRLIGLVEGLAQR